MKVQDIEKYKEGDPFPPSSKLAQSLLALTVIRETRDKLGCGELLLILDDENYFPLQVVNIYDPDQLAYMEGVISAKGIVRQLLSELYS